MAVEAIKAAGFTIKGIIVDGKQALFKEFEKYPVLSLVVTITQNDFPMFGNSFTKDGETDIQW